MSLRPETDHVLFGAPSTSDVKPIEGRIDGFRIISIIPEISTFFQFVEQVNVPADGTIALQFPPAGVFSIQIQSFISGCGQLSSHEIASIQYCSR